MCWPTLACTPPDPAWCWRRQRCHRTTSRIGARPLALPSCDPGWLASGTALRSPIQASSPPPSTSWARRPDSVAATSRPTTPKHNKRVGVQEAARAVERLVELAVAGAVEPNPDGLAAGGRDRGGLGEHGEGGVGAAAARMGPATEHDGGHDRAHPAAAEQ